MIPSPLSTLRSKARWRRHFLAARRTLTPRQHQRKGLIILQRILAEPQWPQFGTIGVYTALSDEVPTLELIQTALQEGKRVALPCLAPGSQDLTFRTISDVGELCPGPLGILQPRKGRSVALRRLQLVFVPGVGFDRQGNRLGFGQGYFDRCLCQCPAQRWGLAFETQLCAQLPVTPWDIPMHRIITEKKVWVNRRV